MIIYYLIRIINFAASLLILIVLVDIVLSYFMDPYQPLRQVLDRIVNPMLNPIRRVVPLIGMFDISPMILLLLIYVLQSAVVNLLSTFVR